MSSIAGTSPRTGYGDCEDYQLLKRRMARQMPACPRRAMRMTRGSRPSATRGMPCSRSLTDRGPFILDNVTDTILPWDETPYTYIKREGHDNTGWVSLGGNRRIAVGRGRDALNQAPVRPPSIESLHTRLEAFPVGDIARRRGPQTGNGGLVGVRGSPWPARRR